MSRERLANDPVSQEVGVPEEAVDPESQQGALYEQFSRLKVGQQVFVETVERPFSRAEVLKGEIVGITIRETSNRCALYLRKSSGREISVGLADIEAIHVADTVAN